MKNFFLTLALILMAGGVFAQNSNLVLFAEQGERFTAILNGLRINEAPVTHLRITGLQAPTYKMKIIFENKAFGEMDKTVMLTPGQEMTYNIKKNQKGEYVLRFISQIDAVKSTAQPGQTVYAYGDPAPVVTGTASSQNSGSNNGNINMNVNASGSGTGSGTQTTTYQQTTTTTTTTSGNPNTGGVGVNMNVNDGSTGENVNVNMNIGVNGTGMGMNMNVNGTSTQSSSVTTTTTTTSSSGGTGYSNTQQQSSGQSYSSGGCVAISQSSFQAAVTSINSKSFEDSKLTTAKQVISKNCMTSAQIKQIMGLFSFEESKMTFAKYAWSYCLDPENYFTVNDAFGFESSIEELDEYTRANPR